MAIKSFKRVEEKYLITEDEKNELLKTIQKYMTLDPYCINQTPYKIQNIYYDTINNDLISNSINKPIYKQKIRVRKYDNDNTYYLEIKNLSISPLEITVFSIVNGCCARSDGYCNIMDTSAGGCVTMSDNPGYFVMSKSLCVLPVGYSGSSWGAHNFDCYALIIGY